MSIKRKLFGRAGGMLVVAFLLVPLLAACGGTTATDTPAVTSTDTPAAAAPTNTVAAAPPATDTTAASASTPTEVMTGTTPTTGGTGGTGTTTGTLKVGLVTDVGRLNDKSFNQSSWEGVELAKTQLGIQDKAIETTDTKDYAKNIQQFIDDKYDAIVTVGFNLGAATITAAKANPNVKFIGVDQFQTDVIPNLAALVFEEDKAGYQAGVLAASISKSNNIGAVCGTDAVPPVWRYCEGYKAGAKSVKPNVTVQVVYHSDVDITKTFVDPDWGKTTALSMIDRGADVVFGAGGQTGNGAIYAAQQKNIAAIGVDTDQYFTIGDQYKGALVSSAMKLLTPGVANIIKSVKDGTFKGGNITGTTGLAPFHDMDAKVPADVKAKLTQLASGLNDGSIKTCISPAKGAPSPCGGAGAAATATP